MDQKNITDSITPVDTNTIEIEKLKDICEVEVNTELPIEERIKDFIEQIGDPYCFRCGTFIVEIEYKETEKTITDCLKEYMENQAY